MISVERAKELRAMIEKAVESLEDGEAINCAELFPAWAEGVNYTVGVRVQYNGQLYQVVQAHTSQSDWTPDVAVSLFTPVTVNAETGYDEWTQPTGGHNAYNTGDRVVYNGTVYESLIDGNVYSPEAYPAGWTLLG